MYRHKSLIAFALLTLLALVAVACAPSPTPAPPAAPQVVTAPPVVVTAPPVVQTVIVAGTPQTQIVTATPPATKVAPTGPGTKSITVIANWTGGEREAFQAVLDAFTAKTGIQVAYESARDNLEPVLRTRVAGGNPRTLLWNPALAHSANSLAQVTSFSLMHQAKR